MAAAMTATTARPVMGAVSKPVERLKASIKKLTNCRIRRIVDSGEHDNACGHKRTICSGTDISADDHIDLVCHQQQRELVVFDFPGIQALRGLHRILDYGVESELRRFSEVSEHPVILDRNRNFSIHILTFPFFP